MADAEPAAEQLVTLQCGERTLETLDWESVLRTQGEDFWDGRSLPVSRFRVEGGGGRGGRFRRAHGSEC